MMEEENKGGRRVKALEDRVSAPGALLLQVVGGSDPGDPGTHDQDIYLLFNHPPAPLARSTRALSCVLASILAQTRDARTGQAAGHIELRPGGC